jgi:hypothetical protein
MFVFDCECHMLPPAEDLRYFPLYKMNQGALRALTRRIEPLSLQTPIHDRAKRAGFNLARILKVTVPKTEKGARKDV